jgi:hypothetical protein
MSVFAVETNRIRRFGSLALLAAMGIAAIVFGAMLISRINSADTEAQLNRLARYEAEIAARPQLQKDLQVVRQQEASVPSVLQGENAAVAGARLQTQLRALVQESGGFVRSTQDLPPKRRAGLELINVVCEFTLPMTKLKDMLHRLDAAEPYIFVDDATIDARDDAGQDFDVELSVRLTVHAFRVPGAA